MTIKFEQDGKTYEFRGEYRMPKKGEYFLSSSGTLSLFEGYFGYYFENVEPRAILHLILEVLEFGGVKFIKTGEDRTPQKGEWYLSVRKDNNPVFCHAPYKTYFTAEILKPLVSEINENPLCSVHKQYARQYSPEGFCRFCLAEKDKKDTIELKVSTINKINELGSIPAGTFRNSAIEEEIVDACRNVSSAGNEPLEHVWWCKDAWCECRRNR